LALSHLKQDDSPRCQEPAQRGCDGTIGRKAIRPAIQRQKRLEAGDKVDPKEIDQVLGVREPAYFEKHP